MMIADGGGAQHDLDLPLGVRARTGLSGKSALAVGVGPLGAGTGEGAAENGPPKASGFTVGAVATAAGGLIAGASLWPTE